MMRSVLQQRQRVTVPCFPLVMGGGVTDDHQKLIEQGIRPST